MGSITDKVEEKAEVFSVFFASFFGGQISYLQGLGLSQAHGADGTHPRILREMVEVIAKLSSII